VETCIIGLAGRAGSGKDTVANILVRDHGFIKIAFADALKRVCRDVFAFTEEQLWGPSEARNAPDFRYPRGAEEYREAYAREKDRDPELAAGYAREGWLTPRHALQQLGTEWGRACYPNVWVDLVMRATDRLLHGSRDALDYCNYYSAQSGVIFVGGLPRPKGIAISDVRFPNEVTAIRAKGGVLWKTTHGAGLTDAAGDHESEQHVDSLKVNWAVPDVALEALPAIVTTMLKEVRG
jgi:hypothetical protein